jgi:hypothetical protein
VSLLLPYCCPSAAFAFAAAAAAGVTAKEFQDELKKLGIYEGA